MFSLLALFMALAAAEETLWTTENVDSTRFMNEATSGPSFTAGAQVTVVYREGAVARVQGPGGLGWVPAAKLSDTAPAAPAAPEFDLEAIQRALSEMR